MMGSSTDQTETFTDNNNFEAHGWVPLRQFP